MCIDQKQEKTLLHHNQWLYSSYYWFMLYFMVHKGRSLCLWLLSCGRNVCDVFSWKKWPKGQNMKTCSVAALYGVVFVFFFFTSLLTTTHTVSISISRLLHRCLQTPGTPLMLLIRIRISLVRLCAFISKGPRGLSHGRGPLFWHRPTPYSLTLTGHFQRRRDAQVVSSRISSK